MNTIHVELVSLAKKNSPHIGTIIAGYSELQDLGIIKLSIKEKNEYSNMNTAMVIATINNTTRILYDMLDGYNFDKKLYDEILEKIDICYKRSFSEKMNQQYTYKDKIYPFGFCFYITPKKNRVKALLSNLKSLKSTIDLFRGYSNTTFTRNYFEIPPRYNPDRPPKIIFCARIWDPDELDDSRDPSGILRKQRAQINAMRIDIIRELKHNFGENFFGGLEKSDYSLQLAPELIIQPSHTIRHNYIKLMHNHDICIATTGLHNSIGFKFGEYIAASKAILSEKLHYQVTGNFQKNKNYLEYNSAEECISFINTLSRNRNLICKMQYENYTYYHKYLRADVQILNTLLHSLQMQYTDTENNLTHHNA